MSCSVDPIVNAILRPVEPLVLVDGNPPIPVMNSLVWHNWIEADEVERPFSNGIKSAYVVVRNATKKKDRSMEKITTVGLDLAKSVFQVHGIARDGTVIVRRALRRFQVLDFFRRLQPCLVGMEACGSAHHWAREIQALGHTVRMMNCSLSEGAGL